MHKSQIQAGTVRSLAGRRRSSQRAQPATIPSTAIPLWGSSIRICWRAVSSPCECVSTNAPLAAQASGNTEAARRLVRRPVRTRHSKNANPAVSAAKKRWWATVESRRLAMKEILPSGPGEVVIALEASPINQYDLLMIAGGYGYRPRLPAIVGTEGV